MVPFITVKILVVLPSAPETWLGDAVGVTSPVQESGLLLAKSLPVAAGGVEVSVASCKTAAALSSPGATVATTCKVPWLTVIVGLGFTVNVVLKVVAMFAQVAVALR